jgi:hypothetical protein
MDIRRNRIAQMAAAACVAATVAGFAAAAPPSAAAAPRAAAAGSSATSHSGVLPPLTGAALTRAANLVDHASPGSPASAATATVGQDCRSPRQTAIGGTAPATPRCAQYARSAAPPPTKTQATQAQTTQAQTTKTQTTGPAVSSSDPMPELEDVGDGGTDNVAVLPVPGRAGDVVRFEGDGDVAVVKPNGLTLWDREPMSLIPAWKATMPPPRSNGYVNYWQPIIPFGPSPIEPTQTAGTPYAVGHLTGEKDPVVAVGEFADLVGANLPAGHPALPNSFVTVLDARTGTVLWDQEYPGYIMQVAITGGRLIVGDSAGPASAGAGHWESADPGGPAGTVSDLDAWAFSPSNPGLSAQRIWRYSTKTPNALWLSLAPAGPSDLAVGWTDTPLGFPGVPDGHVVLLSAASGRVQWAVNTTGYPRSVGYDPTRDEVVTLEQTDPTQGIGYSLDGLALASGAVADRVTKASAEPFDDLQVGNVTGATGLDNWVLTQQIYVTCPPPFGGSCPSHTQAVVYTPGSNTPVWHSDLPNPSKLLLNSDLPYGLALTSGPSGPEVVVGAEQLDLNQDPTSPLGSLSLTGYGLGAYSDLRGLAGATGALIWDDSGGDEVSAPYLAVTDYHGATAIASVNQEQDLHLFDASTGALADSAAMLAGQMWTATGGPGPKLHEVITGGESGGVYALSPTTRHGQPQVLWHTSLGAPVHQIQLAQLTPSGPPSLVVAATDQIAVLSLTGAIRYQLSFPHQFVWSAAVGDFDGKSAIVVPTNALTAVNGQTGALLWRYRPDQGTALFSDAAVSAAGTVVSMYTVPPATGSLPGSATDQTALGITGFNGKVAWHTAGANPSGTYTEPDLFGGVLASQDIPGAGGNGVALAWNEGPTQGLDSTEIDVRDADTGALDYTQNVGETSNIQMSASPSAGLTACLGLVLDAVAEIGPSGVTKQSPDPVGCGGAAVVQDRSGAADVLATGVEPWSLQVAPASYLTSGGTPVSVYDQRNSIGPTSVAGLGPAGVAEGLSYDWEAEQDIGIPLNIYGYEAQAAQIPSGITIYSLPGAGTSQARRAR